QPFLSFGAHVFDFGLERIRSFAHAPGDRPGPGVQILFDAVAELADPFVFEIGRTERTRNRGADRQAYCAEEKRLFLEQIRERRLDLRDRLRPGQHTAELAEVLPRISDTLIE